MFRSLTRYLVVMTAGAIPLAAQVDFADLDRSATEELAKYKIPGASIAVVRADRVVYSRALGTADLETGEAMRSGNARADRLDHQNVHCSRLDRARRGRKDRFERAGPDAAENPPAPPLPIDSNSFGCCGRGKFVAANVRPRRPKTHDDTRGSTPLHAAARTVFPRLRRLLCSSSGGDNSSRLRKPGPHDRNVRK